MPDASTSHIAETLNTVSDGDSGSSGEALRAVKRAQRMSREATQATEMCVQQDPRPLLVEPVNACPRVLDIDSLENSACGDGDQEVAKQDVTTCESHSDRETPQLGIGVSPIAEAQSPGLFDFDVWRGQWLTWATATRVSTKVQTDGFQRRRAV